MSELKTLKDLIYVDKPEMVEPKELRQEVAKWIKFFNQDYFMLKNDIPSSAVGHFERYLTKDDKELLTYVLRIIFNITEEDLKK